MARYVLTMGGPPVHRFSIVYIYVGAVRFLKVDKKEQLERRVLHGVEIGESPADYRPDHIQLQLSKVAHLHEKDVRLQERVQNKLVS